MPTISFKGRHFQHDMILQSVRWYLAYALSYRDIEELMQERGFSVDHSTINRWVLHYSPQLDAAFRRKKKRVGKRWRMDETYVKVKGQWKYYYRAIDKQGQTIDFLLTASRDTKAALRFLKKAWSIPDLVDTSEKRDTAPGGVSCHNDFVTRNNLKKRLSG